MDVGKQRRAGHHSIERPDSGRGPWERRDLWPQSVQSEQSTLRHASRYRDASAPTLATMRSALAPFLAVPFVSPTGAFMPERLPQQAYTDDHLAITGP